MAGFRISQTTPGAGVTDRSRFDLVVGEDITLLALDPAPGDGITYQWEIIDRAGSDTELSAVSGNTATIAAQATAPFSFLVELRAYANDVLIGRARRAFGARSPSKGLRLPLFSETADPAARLAARNIPASTDNEVYVDRAGTGVTEQNWRGWTEFLHEIVLALEDAGEGGGGGGAIGRTVVVGPVGPGSVLDLEIPSVATVRVVMLTCDIGTVLESILPPPTEGDPAPTDWHSIILVNFTSNPVTLKVNGTGSYGSLLISGDGADYELAPYQGVLLGYLHYTAAWTIHPLAASGGGGGGGSGDIEGPGTATAGSLAAFVDGTHIEEAGLGVVDGNLVLAGGKTVDGRDISVDGTKLDTVESNAQVTSAARVLTALAAAAADISVNTHKITNLQDPTNPQDAATRAYVLANVGGGSGDVVGPAGAVDGNLPSFDSNTGKLLDDSGITAASVTAALSTLAIASTPAVYRGGTYTPNELRYVSGAWAGVISSVFTGTWTDDEQTGITRAGESFTVAQAGRYRIYAYFPSFVSGAPPLRGLRAKVNGTVVASALSYGGSASGTTSDPALEDVLTLAANDVITFDYINITGTTSFGAFSNNQMGGINIKTAQIVIERVTSSIGASQAAVDAAVATAIAGAASVATAYYQGRSAKGAGTASLTSTTWASFIGIFSGTWVDDLASNISRVGNTFTVAVAGLYTFNMSTNVFGSGSTGYMGLRVRSLGQTLASNVDYVVNASSAPRNLYANLQLAAGQAFTVEYVTSFAQTFNNVASLDGDTLPVGNISISLASPTVVGATQVQVDAAVSAAGAQGWRTYCDFNFTQLPNQTLTDGNVTIDGVPMVCGNIASGVASAAIVNGTGLVFTANGTSTYWYYSGHLAAYLAADLPVHVPGWQINNSKVRISAECYLTVGTANYATASWGLTKHPFVSNNDWVHMQRMVYASGTTRSVHQLHIASEYYKDFSTTYKIGQIVMDGLYSVSHYIRTWSGADSDSNQVAFGDPKQFELTSVSDQNPAGATPAIYTPPITNGDHFLAFVCGQNGNTLGNTVCTFKRLRIEYKL